MKIDRVKNLPSGSDAAGFQNMIEDIFVFKAYDGSKSARAVIDKKSGEVHLLCTDADTLKAIKDALVRGAVVRGRKIKPPTKNEIEEWLESEFYTLPVSEQKRVVKMLNH